MRQRIQSIPWRKSLVLITLVLAGEMIFALPFHIARFFRPTFLQVFELTNTQLGGIFAFYGVTAMLSYFPGGPLADRYAPRTLMATALFATAAGGVVLASIPSGTVLGLLFAYWGVTTILLFWSAMIKATRQWGGEANQGKAFGLLDGGRGMAAAVIALGAVWLFGHWIAEPVTESTSALENHQALQKVILLYSAITAVTGIAVMAIVPSANNTASERGTVTWQTAKTLMRRRDIWLQALIVICAYCGYKGLDNYGLYAHEAFAISEVESAELMSSTAFLRPLSAIAAGFLADRFLASRVIAIGFAMLAAAYSFLALSTPAAVSALLLIANIMVSFVAVFAIRGVYFALLSQSRIPPATTGTAVGIISLVGFTPDIFFAPVAGTLLDAAPGVAGHRAFFAFLLCFAVAGLTATWVFNRLTRLPASTQETEQTHSAAAKSASAGEHPTKR